ncbi:hypothetical protein HGRIS_002880 [Hohenbuehelia grisea]|uniref:U3 small nucleolar RNA-associated protein 25 n=1 Tax=Hohenbuehelia grisea TaxID=104357 RepID=A0ABR3JLZ8_9AGAR
MNDLTTTTKLLTLLNVSATQSGKRRRLYEEVLPAGEKLNKRKPVQFTAPDDDSSKEAEPSPTEKETDAIVVDDGHEGVADEDQGTSDPYETHFGIKPIDLTDSSRSQVDSRAWAITRTKYGRLGPLSISVPEGSNPPTSAATGETGLLERLKTPFKARQGKQPQEQTMYQNDLLSVLSTNRDVCLSSQPYEVQTCMREAISLHALNHVTKKRRRILKNNERISNATKADANASTPDDVQDQGFTRPSVLFLLPFRSSALTWFRALTCHTPSPAYQIENQSRFMTEYGLPPGAVDKLASAEPGTYPRDHVETFKGNIDDNFRVGIKMTRKSVKMFTEFYGSDIIMASPLGLRMSIEKEKGADFLSSIEIIVVDQMDALLMQNWEHVQFVFSHLNQLPKGSHDTDFSRVKPWYLDGHAAFLRQSILLSAFESPETRSLYNNRLTNVSGKIRNEKRWPAVEIPEGVNQQFISFDCINPKDELDKRFNHFTTQVLPAVLKSAVQSVNTVVFVPSSFDFIRVHNYFRKHAGVSFAVLSEYSTNQEISRARQAFFLGKKSFLLVSERFHFYRRYKIRGIRNILFYGPPDHPQYFPEFLSYPFLDDGVEASDITCKILYSKYDWFKLERIAGSDGAAELIKAV